ncbi:MAG TPA: single-stranded DNA-specific exonuclease, partial [Candidatus Bathyarchaeota archaeon]|nr:single-stranded DNA-specific exonuclease [Candidatus Bathyarchaeota archaeon]
MSLPEGSTIIVHHWDADGLCSAALLLDWLEGRGAENWTPPLGSFYLESQDLEMLSAYDNVVVCDMALPEGDIQALAKHS